MSDKKSWQQKFDAALAADPSLRPKLDELADKWLANEKQSINRAGDAFTYIEWAIVFGALDFARSISGGMDLIGLWVVQIVLGALVFFHFVNRYFSILGYFGTRDKLWASILTWRMPALLFRSLVGTTAVLFLGWWLSQVVQRADRYEAPAPLVLECRAGVPSLSYSQMPGGSNCER